MRRIRHAAKERFSLETLLCGTLAVGLCLAAGCVRVHAHQRERLAHPAMQGSVWAEEDKSEQHVFEVREASKGATGKTGGGCGCN